MKKTSEPIVFFGSGPVAAESLRLLAQNFNIKTVVTKPKPAHHKAKFPVLDVAAEINSEVILTSTKADLVEQMQTFKSASRLGIVIDYGIIIPQEVIDRFELGIINSHFSLLPRWRGADPITYAILNGDQKTGISLMKIVEQLDEGPLLAQAEMSLSEEANSTTLTNDLIELSDSLLSDIVPKYLNGEIKLTEQADKGITYSNKLKKEDGRLDFNKSAEVLERQIRAFNEWPRSYTEIEGIRVIVTKAHVESLSGQPGKLYHSADKLGFFTKDKVLIFDQLIPANKKEMSASAFLAGHKITAD